MTHHFYDLESNNEFSVNYRWLQPPQIAYFVSTMDEFGNSNLTPVTLGTLVCAQYPRDGQPGAYYFAFSVGCKNLPDENNELEVRHAFRNLQKRSECVISYIGYDLMYESTVCNMPIPYGISEFDVAGLTSVPSSKVAPYSIAECPVNMECKVVSSQNLDGYYQLYVCKVVGVSVNKEYIERDKKTGGFGVYAIDPLFEVEVNRGETGNNRLYYGRLDKEKIHRTSDDIGCKGDWVGKFEKWIKSEAERGKLSESDIEEILNLNARWLENRDPVSNAAVKKELTDKLYKICRKP